MTTSHHMCTERYLQHIVKKRNTYWDTYVMWACINFTMFWRKTVQDTVILPPLSRLCWSSVRSSLGYIFLGLVHILLMAVWGMLDEGSTPKGWVLDQPGKVLVMHPCSCCLFLLRFLLPRFPLHHLRSHSFLQTVQSLIWGFDVAWIYTIHYTHKKTL